MTNWNLEEVYKNEEEWNKDFSSFQCLVKNIVSLEGKLNNLEAIEEYLAYEEKISKLISKLYSYSHMKFDQNQKDLKSQELVNKVIKVIYELQSLSAFHNDEFLALGYEKFEEYAKKSKIIKENLFNIKMLFDGRKHILAPVCEQIVSNFGPVTNAFGNLYAALQNSDFEPIDVSLTDGSKVKVSPNNYTSILASLKKQEDRKAVFEAQYSYYDKHKNTLSSIYKGVVDANIANMKTRGYDNILASFLDGEKIPTDVYTSLIQTARENTAPLKRYIKIRQKYFNLPEYHTYDRMLSFSNAKVAYPYEKAYTDVLKALEPMGDDFVAHAKEALKDGHVDVFPTEAKRSGAYSTRIEGYGPYILLNHTDDLESAFTLAHECGHSIHTLYTIESQPFATQDYRIFVAEIPSTLNEQLFLDYLLKNSNNKELKLQAVCKAVDNIVSTFYRQTLFADFEYQAHTKAINGEELNYEVLSNIMANLYKEYYGIDLETEPLKKLVWAYIPHMYYSPFYVYQYATCFSASMKIYEEIKNNKPNAMKNYLNMLKAGASLYPVDVVKLSGVDLTSKEPFEAVCNKLNELLDSLEDLIK